MNSVTELTRSVPSLTRPRVTEHLFTGERTVELPVMAEGHAYIVTIEYNRRPQDSMAAVEAETATGACPTARVPSVLYAALGALWRLETAALDREDAHGVTHWHGAYEAVFAFRGDWLDAQADDTDTDDGPMDGLDRTVLVLPSLAAPTLAVVP